MKKPEAYAMVEILGAANAVQVVDQMVKCATLDMRAWETTCGGHATVILAGDVSACKAASRTPASASCRAKQSAPRRSRFSAMTERRKRDRTSGVALSKTCTLPSGVAGCRPRLRFVPAFGAV